LEAQGLPSSSEKSQLPSTNTTILGLDAKKKKKRTNCTCIWTGMYEKEAMRMVCNKVCVHCCVVARHENSKFVMFDESPGTKHEIVTTFFVNRRTLVLLAYLERR
jgi:hypothetical protein